MINTNERGCETAAAAEPTIKRALGELVGSSAAPEKPPRAPKSDARFAADPIEKPAKLWCEADRLTSQCSMEKKEERGRQGYPVGYMPVALRLQWLCMPKSYTVSENMV